jgi:hypothetical protein
VEGWSKKRSLHRIGRASGVERLLNFAARQAESVRLGGGDRKNWRKLPPVVGWVVILLDDRQHGVDGEAVGPTTQHLGNVAAQTEAELLGIYASD